MGRKRLMTILAGVIAAVGLQMGPAAAVDLGIGSVALDTSDGMTVEAELDAELGDTKLDPKVSADVSSDPKVKAEVGDTELDSSKVTEPVKDAVKDPDGSNPSPEASPSPSEPSDGKTGGSGDDGGSTSGDSSSSDSRSGSTTAADDRDVTTAGRTESFISPERAAQIEAFRAMRDADASFGGETYDGRVVPGVELAPRMAPTGDDAFAGSEVAPGVEVAAPSVAGDRAQQAQLASAPFTGTLPEVPVALQLLAGTLVAGTALAWHLARHELRSVPIVRRSGR
jgi:hypothetical protein